MFAGETSRARSHLEQAKSVYDLEKRPLYHAIYRMDPGVFLYSEDARTLWILGRPDAALKSRDRALELGADSPDQRSLAFANLFAAVLHLLRREVDKCLEYSSRCIAICDEHGIAQERVWAMSIHGWALAHSGKPEEGIKEIEASINIQRLRHAELNLTFALRQLAEAYNMNGSFIAGRDAAREGLKISERHGEVGSKVELYRIMGESARNLAKTGEIEAATHTRSGSTLSPEACFRAAVDLARRHGSKGFELRSSLALARELHERGHDPEAIALVRGIRAQFTEGLDTRDLRDADDFLKSVTT
jgi:adenylate cyclase